MPTTLNITLLPRAFAVTELCEAFKNLMLVGSSDEDMEDGNLIQLCLIFASSYSPSFEALAQPEVDHESTTEDCAENSASESSPRKRLKTIHGDARPVVHHIRARDQLCDLPSEIIKLIGLYLRPPDLLALARSNKLLRGIFMSRSSQYIWSSTMACLDGLPACPPNMAAPRYISLIYSNTCSECGARVLRPMDACLHVRLCAKCRKDLIRALSSTQSILILLPFSLDIFPSMPGIYYILRRDLVEIQEIFEDPRYQNDEAFLMWQVNWRREMELRFEHADLLDKFLRKLKRQQERQVIEQKEARKLEIERRLLENGWSETDMRFPLEETWQWNELVLQPTPLTDKIWSSLRPKLIAMLEANRERNQTRKQTEKQMSRRFKLSQIFSDIIEARPPLAEITVHWENEPKTTRVETPFPTWAEVSKWSPIKDMIDGDIGADEVERIFQEHRDEILQSIGDWRIKVEKDLLAIWNVARAPMVDEPSNTTSNHQSPVGTRRSPRKSAQKSKQDAKPDPMCGSSLPKCTVTLFDTDGSTVSSADSLPDHRSVLLRATTTFHVIPNLLHRYNYPEFLPFPRSGYIPYDGDNSRLAPPWDPSTIERDDEVSHAAQILLGRMGRPDATYAELKAMGEVFVCQRPGCRLAPPMEWDRFVGHYPFEESRWKQAQAELKNSRSKATYNNTHDLSDDDSRPIVDVLSPAKAAVLTFERLDPSPGIDVSVEAYELMLCKVCEKVGIELWLMHTYLPNERSNITEHLQDVHNIMKARVGAHYGPRRKDDE